MEYAGQQIHRGRLDAIGVAVDFPAAATAATDEGSGAGWGLEDSMASDMLRSETG